MVYMGGESPRAKEVIAAQADAYVMHGDAPEVIAGKVADLNGRRAEAGQPPMVFGVSGYVICRDTEAEAQAELERILDVHASPATNQSVPWSQIALLTRLSFASIVCDVPGCGAAGGVRSAEMGTEVTGIDDCAGPVTV